MMPESLLKKRIFQALVFLLNARKKYNFLYTLANTSCYWLARTHISLFLHCRILESIEVYRTSGKNKNFFFIH